MSQSIYGIDLAKHSFSIHGEDENGKVLNHRTITRSKTSQLTPIYRHLISRRQSRLHE